jgi:two-component system response regulator GlrR
LAELAGRAPIFLRIVEHIPIIAASESTVLLQGESGTGKELVARAIHACSGRTGSFVAVNCGAVPAELFEREMFGHRRSAFTGAATSESGLVHAAESGTLLLDEVDSLPHPTQCKLLRFLQEKEYRPLGSPVTLRANVRVIGAANVDLAQAVRNGQFRSDLYYRVSVLPLLLPPLRERREDIPLLAEHFLDRHAQTAGRPRKAVSFQALAILLAHNWPGNIRELQHVIERAVALSADRLSLEARDIQIEGGPRSDSHSFHEAKRRAVAAFERSYLESLLAAHDGNISRAARTAKKNRRALWELLRKHAIDATSFRRGAGLGIERSGFFEAVTIGEAAESLRQKTR